MNYRHAFHAGNFADVHKHVVLVRILLHLRRKPAAFRVIDTHAGAGRYDLLAPEPSRSGEWREGIGRVWREPRQGGSLELLAPYIEAVGAFNPDGELRSYPGSPLIARHFLRPQDRLIACELEPQSVARLGAAAAGDARAKVLAIDGWTALRAYVPPKERRGLVVIDPPFEESADFKRLSDGLALAHRKWPTGIYLLWYPIKTREQPDALARRLQRLGGSRLLRCELNLGPARADVGLIGSGVLVANAPFTLEPDLRDLMPLLRRMLSAQGSCRLDWLVGDGAPTTGGR